MQITKEELQKRITRLEQSNEHYSAEDARIRKEFARAFGWGNKGMYDRSIDYEKPSWEQIFIELGKLLAARTFYDLEGNVSELQQAVSNLQNDTANLAGKQ